MDLGHPVKIGLFIIERSHSFYWFKCFLSHLVLHDIILQVPVYDQSILNMFEVIRNDEVYDAFDCEVCHEYISLGTAIAIFIV